MTESKSEWGTPDQVYQCTETMQRVETARAIDRARVDALANGSRPYTEAEMKEFSHQLNVNWLELTRKLQDATGQVNNAFIPNGNFFTAHCQGGPAAKRPQMGQVFTKAINLVLKRKNSGKRHHYLLRSRNASVALHGIGPLLWSNSYRLLPRFIPLEDLLLPTDTLIDFSNLTYFAVNLYLTPGELYRMACIGKVDKGWNKGAVQRILSDLKTDAGVPFFPPNISDWQERPEALQELYKQNTGYLESDAVPKCKLRSFYYYDCDRQKWYRKIILRDSTPNQPARGDKSAFIYDSDTPHADDLGHILHCQFGDNSLVPPLKYHSVRGLGTMLYAPAFTLNRLRSQAIQHVFQNLMTLFRIQDPNDRDRAKQILLMNNGVVPEGASIIPQNERHQIDARLLEFGLSQMKQNIGENSTSFTPAADTGTKKERTKFEVQAQLQAATAMVSNVLSMMYAQEIYYYEELVRRILLPNTDDPAAKQFQEQCIKNKVPRELLKPEYWHIVPERVLGSGDGALAMAQADALMSQKPTFDPQAQIEIQRLWTSTLLDDPERAAQLVPENPDQSTSGTRAAEDVYGTLMRGIAVPLRRGIDHIGYCAALLAMMEAEITRIMQADGMGTPQDLMGFQTVAKSIMENLQFIAQDERNKPVVKQLNDKLGQLMNLVKAMAQRQQEAMAAQAQQAQVDPEALMKAQSEQLLAQTKAETMQMLAQLKAQISAMNAEQKLAQKQQQFAVKQQQQSEQHAARLRAQGEKTSADLTEQGMRTAADLQAKGMLTAAEVAAKKATRKADEKKTKA